jgi:4-hydroxy-3-methylbut-2-enyl diphosphate reductase IspH
VKELLQDIDLLLVIGSPNSSTRSGSSKSPAPTRTSAHLVDRRHRHRRDRGSGCETVSLTPRRITRPEGVS